MSQISDNIDRELSRLENDSIEIEFSSIVQESLYNIEDMTEWEIEHMQSSLQEAMVKKFSTLHDVSDVLIYTTKNRKLIAYGDKEGFTLNFKQDFLNGYLEKLDKAEGKPVWISSNEEYEERYVQFATSSEQMNKSDCILIGRAIVSLKNSDIIGRLIIRTNEKHFSNIYRDLDIGSGADIFVIDSNGIVVSSRDKGIAISKPYKNSTLAEQILINREKKINAFDMTMDGKLYMVAYSYVPTAKWFVVSTIPYSYLNSEATKIGQKLLILSLLCLLMSIILSYIFSLSVSTPLKHLVKAMNQVKKGNLEIELKDKSTDEIGEVSGNFDIMVKEIKSLMENIKINEKHKRIAEIKALQAQINPHFLSNTLNTVKWLANAQKADNIETLVSSLIQLLHVSMGKGGDYISIRDEIEYIKSYIKIQEFRYFDKFEVIFNIEEDILDYKILKFILQPIIENSIIHGIGPMDEKGLISVKAYKYDDELILSVTDNGTGICKEKIDQVLKSSASKSSFSGIGIYNVNERIKLNFGEQYGLSIQSVEGLYIC
jgi:two-component system sensor histidine kinase YesM